jgi:hypothetical protein
LCGSHIKLLGLLCDSKLWWELYWGWLKVEWEQSLNVLKLLSVSLGVQMRRFMFAIR